MVLIPEPITPYAMTPGGCEGDHLVVRGVARCVQGPPAGKPGGSFSLRAHLGFRVPFPIQGDSGMPAAAGIPTS